MWRFASFLFGGGSYGPPYRPDSSKVRKPKAPAYTKGDRISVERQNRFPGPADFVALNTDHQIPFTLSMEDEMALTIKGIQKSLQAVEKQLDDLSAKRLNFRREEAEERDKKINERLIIFKFNKLFKFIYQRIKRIS